MRKNCQTALNAFNARHTTRLGAPSIHYSPTDDAIYSYATCIMARMSDGRIVFNGTRYSVTTTIHQNAIRAWVPEATEIDDVPCGTPASKLRQLAEAITITGGTNDA